MNEPQVNVDHFYHRPTYHGLSQQGRRPVSLRFYRHGLEVDVSQDRRPGADGLGHTGCRS
jgi:hypothetical protein